MIYHTIQGAEVPALGLGTWRMRGATCRKAVAHALDLGYRHIDTAQMYDNEADVGAGVQASGIDRGAVFLTTKVWHENLEPQAVRRTTEASLRRLATDYVDLLLIHWPNDDVELERTLDAMMALREEGKTRQIGVSNFTVELLEQAAAYAPIFCNQVEYHPYLGQKALLQAAAEHDVLLAAYRPIARGRVMEDDVIQAIAEAHGKSPVQVTLRWLVQQDRVAAIPKAASAEHRAANLDIFDFELADDEMERLFARDQQQRFVDPAVAPDWS